MRGSIFTRSERTKKKYTIGDAVTSAERVLRGKGINKTCVNAVSGRNYSDSITLEELNKLADSIIDDTLYHEGYLMIGSKQP